MWVLIEITEERNLQKVRDDVIKLTAAKNALFANSVLARCYCVIDGSITPSMLQAGEAQHVRVMSLVRFERHFFDFEAYRIVRVQRPFGSAVNPITGERDTRGYVPVKYVNIETGADVDIGTISQWLSARKRVVMLGEYGSGKSRCARQLFESLSDGAEETGCFPIAIDLRDNWGLKRGPELINRHFADLGLDRLSPSVLKAIGSDAFTFILDGFDELGLQAWSNDPDKLRGIRAQSLEGVKDLLARSQSGVFITGREHYFNANPEMFAALGLDAGKTILIKSKEEFDDAEVEEYFDNLGEDFPIPSWLPKRPLICQTISSLSEDELQRLFGQEGGDVEFWNVFIKVICDRDARINASFDAATLFGVLKYLARVTRTKASDTGPVTIGEIQRAFEVVVGQMPVEQAALMLQRLPGLGRLKTKSSDRQFIDTYILDGLRANDVEDCVSRADKSVVHVAWQNPLDVLGQKILARSIGSTGKDANSPLVKKYVQLANRCSSDTNKVLAGDIVSSILRMRDGKFDFGGLALDNCSFADLDMSACVPLNLRISNSLITTLHMPQAEPPGTEIKSTYVTRLYGVSAKSGLPPWASSVAADEFNSVENVSRIRKIGLSPAHEILTTIVRKTFFQKGSGRKEEALLRGLGKNGAANAERILNLLMRENLIARFKGNEGWVYTPNRAHAGRMKQMIAELGLSKDPVWAEVEEL